MVEEGTTPEGEPVTGTPRVVKKVVKKTVVRPVAPTAPARETATPPRATAVSRLRGKDARTPTPAPDEDARTSAGQSPAGRTGGPRTTIDVGAGLGALRGRAGDALHDGAELARRLGFAVRDRGEDAVWAVRDYRVPTVPPLRASVITGLLAGLLVTAGGWLCLELFSAVRGTSAGGGWGVLAVLVVLGVGVELAARLLTAFGVQQARAVLTLSVMVVAVVVMLFFLDPVDGPWAWVIVPALMVVTVPLVQRLLVAAASDVPADDAHR
jgi:hypothetical protein